MIGTLHRLLFLLFSTPESIALVGDLDSIQSLQQLKWFGFISAYDVSGISDGAGSLLK